MLATGAGSSMSQPSGACDTHSLARSLESRDTAGGDGPERPRAHQVDADPLAAEVARQVPRDRLQGGLGDAHPVVDRPGHGGVEVQPDDPRAGRHQRGHRGPQRLQRERAGLKRLRRAVGGRAQELSAERVLGRERDRVQRPVKPVPALAQVLDEPSKSSGLLTSSSSTSGGSGSRLAARSVIRRTRPKLVSTTEAPSR